MRIGWVAVLGILLVAASFGLARLTSAQTPTPTGGPTDTPSPTASPSPTPYSGPTSTITIRLVTNGHQVTVLRTSQYPVIVADGVICRMPLEPAVSVEIPSTGYSTDWPLAPEVVQPVQCSKGPRTNLRFEFRTTTLVLVAELVWTGENLTADIEVPPSPAPTSPASLPDTGSHGANRESDRLVVKATALWLIVAASLAAALATRRRMGN
jgi:hypothetical protein